MLRDLYKNQSKHNEKTQDSSRLQSPKAGWKKSESLPVSLSLLSHRRLSCNIWNTHRSQPAYSYFRPCQKKNELSVNHEDLCERESKPWNSQGMNGQRILRLHYATWLPDSCDTFLHRIRVAPAALASMSAQVMSASSLASWESLGISMCVCVCVFSPCQFFILRNWTCALIPWYLVPAAKRIITQLFQKKNVNIFFIPFIWHQRPAKQAKSRAPLHSVSMDCAGGERSIDFPCELMENMVFQWRLDAKTHKHKQKIYPK